MAQTGADARFTLDTNVLVYSVDNRDAARHRVASRIVDHAVDGNCVLTLQSLSEFFSAVTRKRIVPADRAATLVSHWLTLFPAAPASANALRAAIGFATAGRASYWDALLVASAAEAGCSLILTEDLTDGDILGGVEVHNPFAASGGPTARAQALLGL